MARADLLIDLVRAGARGDQTMFRKVVEALIADERGKQHNVLADRLSAHLQSSNNSQPNPARQPPSIGDLFHSLHPERRLEELQLNKEVIRACLEVVEEQHRADLLRAHNMEPRHRILLAGPPGNGKTSLAEAIAFELAVPLFVVRYEAVIASFLGETAVRLSKLFEQVRTRRCVLFFDEFDVVGKERGDIHETGEIKRVVSSLLLQIDALPSHVVVVTATNHPELLDRAVWRRFQLRLRLPPPTLKQTQAWFENFQARFGTPLGFAPAVLARQMKGHSYSELEQFALDVTRRFVLELPEANPRRIVKERLEQWSTRFTLDESADEVLGND